MVDGCEQRAVWLLARGNGNGLVTNVGASFVAEGWLTISNLSGELKIFAEGSNGWQKESGPSYSFQRTAGSRLGSGAAASGSIVAAAAANMTVNGDMNQGAVYLFGHSF